MGRFLLARLVGALPAAWGILSIIFLLSRGLADRPAALQAPQGENLTMHATMPAQAALAERALRKRRGLDIPLFYLTPKPDPSPTSPNWRWQWHGTQNQYHVWLSGMIRGDLGRSFRDEQPVRSILIRALACTLPLTIGAFLTICAAGYGLTLVLARRPGMRPTVLAGLHTLQTLPLFVIALLLLLLLANPDILTLFPAYGLARPDAETLWLGQALGFLHHLTLPLLSLVLVSLPSMVVPLSNALQQELQADYIRTARAKGLSPKTVIGRHALRNALLPAITYLSDLLPALVAGAVVVELIFALPGMGRLLAEAAATQDFPVLLGGVLLIALVRLLAQILADCLYYQADPRIRLEA